MQTMIPGLITGQNFIRHQYDWLLLSSLNHKERTAQAVMCFVIWRERCRRIFKEEEKTVQVLVAEISAEHDSWFKPL